MAPSDKINLSDSMMDSCGTFALCAVLLAKNHTSSKQDNSTLDIRSGEVKQTKIVMLHIMLPQKCKSEFFLLLDDTDL